MKGQTWKEIVKDENEIVRGNLDNLLQNIEQLDKQYEELNHMEGMKKINEKFLLDLLADFDAFNTGKKILDIKHYS